MAPDRVCLGSSGVDVIIDLVPYFGKGGDDGVLIFLPLSGVFYLLGNLLLWKHSPIDFRSVTVKNSTKRGLQTSSVLW